MKKVVRLTEADLEKLVKRIISEEKKEDKWIQSALKDSHEGRLTDFCGGKVTCECVNRALDNKKMMKGAQMYLNMNPDKCKNLQ